ncbi:MAG: type II toxin-antitoxin system Phd/YefM family antitoxin [Proteobacteria bacterium]|nr:type II toxin-antitoxin system Phd/YefM family antitoxin [Pseudomonadota bacterium]
MSSISANSLKTQGVSAIADALAQAPEAVVSVRGKDRFVVMEIEHYRYLRECELTAALAESQADIAAGRYVTESVDAHMRRLARRQ